jgi:hypothetical protein
MFYLPGFYSVCPETNSTMSPERTTLSSTYEPLFWAIRRLLLELNGTCLYKVFSRRPTLFRWTTCLGYEAYALGGEAPGPALFSWQLLAYDLAARLSAVGDFERGLPTEELVCQNAAGPGERRRTVSDLWRGFAQGFEGFAQGFEGFEVLRYIARVFWDGN